MAPRDCDHVAEELHMAQFKNARNKIYLLVAPWRSGPAHGAMQGFSEDAFSLLAALWRRRAAHGAVKILAEMMEWKRSSPTSVDLMLRMSH
ncbi:hypothetical protein L195_g014361 [Trifolium pratense]|uniref:Uncharacterized protein n=1 Tax=Trifolium pratense TaxID=57577 RepID=A0A2K3PQP8_TRIPR|nr:hypothetical protein L195_g014361 [Trifolium pratense]